MPSEKPRALIIAVAIALVLGVLSGPSPAQAAPFGGADSVLNGSDFTAISVDGWNVDGTAIWTNTADEWAEYQVDLAAG